MSFVLTAALPWLLLAGCVAITPRLERSLTPLVFTMALPCTTAALAAASATSATAVGAVGVCSDSVPARVLGTALLATVAWRLVSSGRHARYVRASRRATIPFARARPAGSDVLVIDDPEPDAFATPVGSGVIVITAGMCQTLRPEELSALIEHERAHLRYRHSMWIQLCEFSARLNPMADSVVGAVRHAAERHADEVAATAGRGALVRALARAALARSDQRRPPDVCALHGGGGDVVRRVRALTEPTLPASPKRGAAALALVALVAVVLTAALGDVVQDCVAPEAGEPATAVFR